MTRIGKTADAAQIFATLARELSDQPDLATAQRRTVELATTLIGCSGAALVRVAPSGRLDVQSATDQDLVASIARIVNSSRQGPALQAHHDQAMVLVDDLGTDSRWPTYAARMVRSTGIRSVAAHQLCSAETDQGVLVLFSEQADYFDPVLTGLLRVFADHAAIALAFVAARDLVDNLQIALQSNRTIGAAIGFLMAREALDEDAAFRELKQRSQQLNVKLRDIAELILSGGTLPEPSASVATSAST